jgi:peptidoglycan/xylan/chitin deacetylase (PgdA/CDA1 family)
VRSLTSRAFETPRLRRGEIVTGLYSADTFPEQIAISFDDVPKPDFTTEVIGWLAEAKVQATFFVVGRLVRRYPGLVKRIVDAGHELGNHTYTHKSWTTLSVGEITDELDRTQDAVDRALGYHYPMRLVRPPYGLPYYGPKRPRAIERASRAIAAHKACVVLWTLGSGDTVPGCTPKRMLSGLRSRFSVGTGGTLVFHPTNCTKRSLRPVLRLVREEGLRVRTVREFLEDKYGWPLDELAEWGPKLLAAGPSTAKR